MITNLDHVAIAVWDIDKSLPYYTEQLGMKVICDETLLSVGVRLTYLDAGNTMVQLVQPVGDTPIRKHLEEHGEGLHHLCFGVEDIPHLLENLQGEQNAKVGIGGRERRTSFIGGKPNGVTIELTEMEPFKG